MIFLLRHGDAEDDFGAGDAARELSENGRAQSDAAGRAMHRLGFEIDVCLASPKVRARDTALLACRHLGLEPEICPPIADGYYDTLELVVGRGNVMLVGHEPDMSSEVARLTGARVKLKKGGLAVLEPGQLRILMLPAELAIVARTWRKGPATGSLVPRSRRGPARPKVDSHGVL
jgi:phosphohistidine phosphatase